jgi:hypothetical protein
MSDDREPEIQRLLAELDLLAEEQRVADGRDPHALVECDRKLADLRRRIERLQKLGVDNTGTKSWAAKV